MPITYPFIREMRARAQAWTREDESNTATRVWTVVMAPGTLESLTALPAPATFGLPELGSEHPTVPDAILKSWSVSETEAGALIYTASYEKPDSIDDAGTAPGEETEELYEWETAREYSGGSENRDLVADAATGAPVLLPTGEPFESVPSVPVPTWTFRLEKKTNRFPVELCAAHGTINENAILIDGLFQVQRHTGLLAVTVSRLYGERARYTVTVTVTKISKKVKLTPTGELTEIGHDTALLLAGYRALNTAGELIQLTAPDEKTGEAVPKSTPTLLTDTGIVYEATDGTGYYKRIQGIASTTWDATWFAAPNPEDEEDTTEGA